MKFLIDECLHLSLVQVAQDRGYEATHVTWRGLGGVKDWNLMAPIIAEDFTLVTNNARDFRKLYAAEPLHAGLVILIPNVPPERQRQLFDVVLDQLQESGDLANEAIEIFYDGDEAVIERYALEAP